MDHRLIQALLDGIAPVIKAEIGALRDRIALLEAAGAIEVRGVDGAPGRDGEPGKDGIDGKDGADGKDGIPGAPGVDGSAGKDGIDGKDGAPGKDAVLDTLMIADAIREMKDFGQLVHGLVAEQIKEHIDSNPPLRGPQGPQGEPGVTVNGKDGAPGKDGENGRDGRDGQPGVPGLPGQKGADGQDGLGIDDYEVEIEEDGRTEVRRWKRGGETVKEIRLRHAWPLYRDVWQPKGYAKGDIVTSSNESWIAVTDNSDKPPSASWRLMARKGRDGKDGDRPAPAVGPVKLR